MNEKHKWSWIDIIISILSFYVYINIIAMSVLFAISKLLNLFNIYEGIEEILTIIIIIIVTAFCVFLTWKIISKQYIFLAKKNSKLKYLYIVLLFSISFILFPNPVNKFVYDTAEVNKKIETELNELTTTEDNKIHYHYREEID